MIPAPRKLSVFERKGSTANHPLAKDEVEAIGGAYLDFARTWVTASVGTSSRAKVVAEDLAIGLAIVKVCTSRPNPDGTMPTMRIKAIWDGLFETGEVNRAFDYHRWRVIRDLMETQGGLEVVDRRYFTGFVNEEGHEIKGRAARWHMAQWLVERLDQVAECGYQDEQAEDSSILEDRERALLEQEIQTDRDQAEVCDSSPLEGRERALLEQEQSENPLIRLSSHGKMGALLEQGHVEDEDYGFDDNWIVEFRRDYQQIFGLIWGGSIENVWREAG